MTSCWYITLRDSHARTEWHIYTDNQSIIKAINKSHRQPGQAIVTNFNDCIDHINDKHPRFRMDIISYYIESSERAASRAEIPLNSYTACSTRSTRSSPLAGLRDRGLDFMFNVKPPPNPSPMRACVKMASVQSAPSGFMNMDDWIMGQDLYIRLISVLYRVDT
jgi:hypothetical protein